MRIKKSNNLRTKPIKDRGSLAIYVSRERSFLSLVLTVKSKFSLNLMCHLLFVLNYGRVCLLRNTEFISRSTLNSCLLSVCTHSAVYKITLRQWLRQSPFLNHRLFHTWMWMLFQTSYIYFLLFYTYMSRTFELLSINWQLHSIISFILHDFITLSLSTKIILDRCVNLCSYSWEKKYSLSHVVEKRQTRYLSRSWIAWTLFVVGSSPVFAPLAVSLKSWSPRPYNRRRKLTVRGTGDRVGMTIQWPSPMQSTTLIQLTV